MRELQYPRRPGERRDPYSEELQLEDGADVPIEQQASGVMGPGVRRDDEILQFDVAYFAASSTET
jgi:hypothetical protein